MKLGFAKRHLRAPFVANSGSSPRAFDSSSSPPSQSPSPCHIRCVEYDRTRWTLGHTRHHSVVIPHRNARATSGQGRYRACDAVQREVSGCSGRDLARKRSRSGWPARNRIDPRPYSKEAEISGKKLAKVPAESQYSGHLRTPPFQTAIPALRRAPSVGRTWKPAVPVDLDPSRDFEIDGDSM